MRPLDLADTIRATPGIEGLTLTGGEPFEQAAQLVTLVSQIRAADLSVMAFTGFELDELDGSTQQELLALCDIVIAGRYRRDQRSLGLAWRGSTNQTVHFLTDRYGPRSLPESSACEVYIDGHGGLTLTGFPPPDLTNGGIAAGSVDDENDLPQTNGTHIGDLLSRPLVR